MAKLPPLPEVPNIPFWDDQPQTWDTVYLTHPTGGRFAIPGVCDVEVDLEERIDVQKPKGRHGATMSDEGADPGKVKVKTVLSTAQDWEQFCAIVQYFRPSRSGTLSVMNIEHPKCAFWGITGVLPHKPKGPTLNKADRTYTVEIDFYENFPPPKKDITKTTDRKLGAFTNAPANRAAGQPAYQRSSANLPPARK